MGLQLSPTLTNSQHGSSLGSVRVHSLTLFALPGACDMTLGSTYKPATLQPPCLGREPRLGLRHYSSRTLLFLHVIFVTHFKYLLTHQVVVLLMLLCFCFFCWYGTSPPFLAMCRLEIRGWSSHTKGALFFLFFF